VISAKKIFYVVGIRECGQDVKNPTLSHKRDKGGAPSNFILNFRFIYLAIWMVRTMPGRSTAMFLFSRFRAETVVL
jgi:hypothetical protein